MIPVTVVRRPSASPAASGLYGALTALLLVLALAPRAPVRGQEAEAGDRVRTTAVPAPSALLSFEVQPGSAPVTGADRSPIEAETPRFGPTPETAALLRAPDLTASIEAEQPEPVPVMAAQQRNRAGVPWMIAGSALILGGALVGDDAGTALMLGGVIMTSYGLFVYF